MTDLLQAEKLVSSRGLRPKRPRIRRTASFSPPSPATPKELFVAIRSMAGGDYLTANLSRAVVQTVRQSQYEVDDVIEVAGRWQFESMERQSDPVPQSDASPLRDQLRNRLVMLLRSAEREGAVAELIASVDEWVSNHSGWPEIASSESFLDGAKRLDEHGQTDSALDIIFDQLDEMLLANEFSRVDRLLLEISPGDFSVDLLLGLLTATLPAKNRLSNRAAFFERVERSLRDRGAADDGLLVGLD